MKHYHNKKELGENDVKYIVVATGQQYSVLFNKLETHYEEVLISQGIKFWLNRCQVIIDSKIIPADRLIIWYSQEKKPPKINSGHFHYYTESDVTIQVAETIEGNPNLGIFNVWTTDNRRCYEFTGNSSIEETTRGDKHSFAARHGWAKGNTPTLEFDIIKL